MTEAERLRQLFKQLTAENIAPEAIKVAFIVEIAGQLAELNDQLRGLTASYGKPALAITTRSNDSVVVTNGGF